MDEKIGSKVDENRMTIGENEGIYVSWEVDQWMKIVSNLNKLLGLKCKILVRTLKEWENNIYFFLVIILLGCTPSRRHHDYSIVKYWQRVKSLMWHATLTPHKVPY